MYLQRNIMMLTMTIVKVAAVTNDCSQPSSNEAFLPKATFAAHFKNLCSHNDGRKGGCSTLGDCNRYGGKHVKDNTCSTKSEECCLFDKKQTKINKKTCFCMEPKYCTGASFSRLCPNSASAKCCSDESNELPECPKIELISYANFKKVYPSLSEQRATAYWPYINKGLSELGSTVTCHVKSSFFAQVFIETLGLLWTEESASGTDYENRASLGNNQDGDGPRFKGRGLLQLTGRSNYQSYKTASGNDVVSYPENASFPYLAMKSSVWFWRHNKLSNLVDGSLLGFHKLVARINGAGMNHLKERVEKWRSISTTLGCPAITDGASDDCNGGQGSCVVDSTCKTKIIPKCNGKACCPRDPKTVKCCLKNGGETSSSPPTTTTKSVPKQPTKSPAAKTLEECINRGEAGDCEFYQCANAHFKCAASDYFLDYGYRYCNRFSQYYSSFDQKGKIWVDAVRKCLMEKVIDIFDLSISCEDLKIRAFSSHPHCYVDSAPGFCNIQSLQNTVGFLKVFEFEDFSGDDADLVIEQIVQTTKSCICRWRDIQGMEDIVSKISKKKFKQITITANTDLSPEADTLAKEGDCRFYRLFEQRFPCSTWRLASHIDDFELPLCERYDEMLDLFEDEGQWVLNARKCMMKELLSVYKSTAIKCTEMLSVIFRIREFCYKQGQFGAFEAKKGNQFPMFQILHFGLKNLFSPYYSRTMTIYRTHLTYLRCQYNDKSLKKYKLYKSKEGVQMKLRLNTL